MASFIRSVDELVENNNAYKKSHEPMPFFSEFAANNVDPPHFVVLGCCDPRADPSVFFNLKPGCMVIRNAGGRANASAVNDILVLDGLMGVTDIVVAHHTDCGQTHSKDANIRATLKERLPSNQEVDSMKFGEILDLEQAVKDDMKFLADSPYLASKKTPAKLHGFLYDIKTGACQRIEG